MSRKAGIIGAVAWGLALSAQASAYSSMGVPGTHNGWTPAASMVLVGDSTWVCTQNLTSANGEFKFAANGSWTINWGGVANQYLLHLPSLGVGVPNQGGSNVFYSGISTGLYVFTFHELTATFDLAPVAPAPNPIAVQLIGSFNGDGATDAGTMTNTSGYVWETAVDLDPGATFLFKVATATATNNRGALAAASISVLPYSGGNPSGSARYTLGVTNGGAFVFTYNLQSNVFGIARIRTNDFVLSSVTAVGDFVSGNPPDVNLEKISRTVWRSDFAIANASRFTLSFLGRDAGGEIGRYWGPTNATTNTLPATGFMPASSNNVFTNLVVTAAPGNYRITFDSDSGAYAVQQRYTLASGLNYLNDPSFESGNLSGGTNWGVYHGAVGEQADFGAHSGSRCGVLQAKTVEGEMDLGNFDQTTATLNNLSGQTFRVSAAFRTKGAWLADTVRIIVEWKNGTNLVSEASAEIVGLSEQWKTYSLDAVVPSNSIAAHVLLKYDGAPGTGYLLVDDAEARIAASRFQNFDGWGGLVSFQSYAPDWAVTHGKTIFNASGNAPTGGVVISKYVEGSDNNKAIEIYNGSAAATNLLTGQYVLQQYNHGATSPSVSIALSGTIDPSQTLIVNRPATPTNAYPPDSRILTAGFNHLATNAVTFNGDDAIVLRKGGTNGPVVDRIGQVGTNVAGTLWSRLATDHTLRRKSTVFWGSTNAPTNAFALSEWTVHAQDDFTELGIHYFTLDDPDAPYLPSGYSLLLNTNASLMTPELEGGIGNVTFYARVQGALAGSDVQIAIETSTNQTSTNWTTAEILSIPLTTTNFTLFSSAGADPSHTVLRIRHIGNGTTNRIRLDDVSVGESYTVRRTENFAGWTNYLGSPIGSYSIAEWSIQNAQINTNGLLRSVSADVYPETGAVTSPTFEGGVGTVRFWLSQHPQDRGEILATVYTSTNGGTSWTSNGAVRLPAPSGTNVLKTNATIAVYLPVESSVRISAGGSPAPFVVDNVDVAIPSISRILDFNDLSVNTSYLSYNKNSWAITDAAIASNLVYSGNSARMRNSTITSPYVDAIGVVSFYYLMSEFSGDSAARLTVEISSDGAGWTVLNSGIVPSAAPQLYSYYNTNANYHYVRIRQTESGRRVLIDQIEIGEPLPAPSCSVAASLSPTAPAPGEGFYVMADVIPQNADILTVTGYYRIASASWNALPMTKVAYGSYRSTLLPPRVAGDKISFRATVAYGGTGALPGSTSYTTNYAYSATNFVVVSSVRRGTVWINELFYAPYAGEGAPPFGTPFDHEFIELCGVAGTSITNWRVELLFASLSDVTKNGGQAKYATYTIPAGTVLSNTVNGYGFYVIGDQQLTTNFPVDQVLTTLIPTSVVWNSATSRDHIRDPSGIVRLYDNYSNLIYSLSYGAYDSSSIHLPVVQSATSNTNSLSLAGTGSEYADFSWNKTNFLSIGAQNGAQTLVPDEGLPFMRAWHTPANVATTSLQGVFSHFHPIDAAQADNLYIHYAYTNSEYTFATIDGRVHHHKQGAGGAWSTAVKQVDFPGNFDASGVAYVRMGPITNYTYKRLDVLEYVIEAIPNDPSLATAWLGSDGNGSSTAYATLEEAQQYPFRYTFPIVDPIEITRFVVVSNTVLRFETDGNDTRDPIVTFSIRSTTNLLLPLAAWDSLPVQSNSRTNEMNYLSLSNPPGFQRYFAVEPLWP